MGYANELRYVIRRYDSSPYWELFFADTGASTGLVLTKENHYFGVGKIDPTERLDVEGNVRLSGALMPNNEPGAAGQHLESAGPATPGVWVNPGAHFVCHNGNIVIHNGEVVYHV